MPPDVAAAFTEMYADFSAGLLTPKGDRTVQATTPIDEILRRWSAEAVHPRFRRRASGAPR